MVRALFPGYLLRSRVKSPSVTPQARPWQGRGNARWLVYEPSERILARASKVPYYSRESRANGSKLVSVEVIIRDLASIRALPVPPAGAEDIDLCELNQRWCASTIS